MKSLLKFEDVLVSSILVLGIWFSGKLSDWAMTQVLLFLIWYRLVMISEKQKPK